MMIGQPGSVVFSRWRRALATIALSLGALSAQAQPFNSANQWTAPHGVGTVVVTAGQEYSTNNRVDFQADTIEILGTVVRKDLEGGFFAIEAEDGRTYEPLNLPDSFQKDGIRIKATVRVKNDAGSIHMVGDIVEIVDLVETNSTSTLADAKDHPSKALREFQTRSGKTIVVSETRSKGRSLSTIAIHTRKFEHDYQEVYEDQDPISDIFLADIDGNGFDELYIITTSTGSGSYGKVIGLASNKDKSLSMIHLPAIEEGDKHFQGYMGHDTFKIEDRKLVRLFPVYNKQDTNQKPTGGTRKLTYGLVPGEAMWQLKVEKAETLSSGGGFKK